VSDVLIPLALWIAGVVLACSAHRLPQSGSVAIGLTAVPPAGFGLGMAFC